MKARQSSGAASVVAILVSLALHVGLTATAAHLAPRIVAPSALRSTSVEIEFAAIEEAPPPPVSPPEVAPPPAPALLEAPKPSPRSTRRPDSPEERLPAPRPSAEIQLPPGPDTEAPTDPWRSEMSLDPRRVALSLLGSAADDPRSVTRSGSRDDTEHDPEGALEDHLRARANAHDYISHRNPPELRPLPGGGFRLVGSQLGARIHPDGTVSFTDRAAVGYAGDVNQAVRLGFELGGRADARHGNDVHRAEREWFMRGTEELRARLEAEAEAEREALASRHIRGRLEGIWNSERLSSAEMHRRIFRLWDDCSERGEGLGARRGIEAFVRERFSRGSAGEFSLDELRGLNEGRRSRAAFSPYAD